MSSDNFYRVDYSLQEKKYLAVHCFASDDQAPNMDRAIKFANSDELFHFLRSDYTEYAPSFSAEARKQLRSEGKEVL